MDGTFNIAGTGTPAWQGFSAGRWRQAIDVRDPIVSNARPYAGALGGGLTISGSEPLVQVQFTRRQLAGAAGPRRWPAAGGGLQRTMIAIGSFATGSLGWTPRRASFLATGLAITLLGAG